MKFERYITKNSCLYYLTEQREEKKSNGTLLSLYNKEVTALVVYFINKYETYFPVKFTKANFTFTFYKRGEAPRLLTTCERGVAGAFCV